MLSQPNIVIKTIPGTTLPNNVPIAVEKRKTVPVEKARIKNVTPDVSISRPAASESKDESRLLPSKGDGNSEISILVIKPKQKDCGHSEPCENIVCDVSVQQYIDQSGVLPMLAVDIDEDEINAPVSKHCRNPLCDALSIEHNRCRRALIKLYRTDEASACDICGTVFKTRRSRMSHRNCVRKEVYRHNQTNGAEILREKMRERELQMIKAAKLKRKEYSDPAMEHKKIMETLRKNNELIVIPKSLPTPQPIITITAVSSQDCSNSPQNTNSKLVPSVPTAFSPQRAGVAKRPGIGTDEGPSVKQPKITNIFCSGLTMASLPTVQTSGQQYIKVTSVTQPNFVQPISLNDWFVSQANIVGSDKSRTLKPYLTPIRVVPITSLKSAPSLRHQTHGIPAFCLVPENLAKPTAVTKLQTIQPAPVVQKATPIPESEVNDEPAVKVTPNARRRSQGRIKSDDRIPKIFKCPFCLKGFSTDWYFKMHVAGHKGEVLFTCKTCEKPFSNRYDLKKHMLNDHNDGECRCETCGQISICKSALEIHIRSHTGERPFRCDECDTSYRSSTDLKTHRRKRHNSADCPYCHLPFTKTDLQVHLISCHMLSEDEALHVISKGQDQNFNSNESSDNLELEIDVSDCEPMANEILSRVKEETTDVEANGTGRGGKAQQDSTDSNKRRKQKRKKNSKIVGNDSSYLKIAEDRLKQVDTKPVVRRSARRSNSAVLCTICKNNFASAILLERHLASKPKDPVQCQGCKSFFHSQTEYKKHTMTCGKSSCTQLCEYYHKV